MTITRCIQGCIAAAALGTASLCIAQDTTAPQREEEIFYRLYPDLQQHGDMVERAFSELKRSGYSARDIGEARAVVAARTRAILAATPSAKPYSQVVKEYKDAVAKDPSLSTVSLAEFAQTMNELTGTNQYDSALQAPTREQTLVAPPAARFEPEDALGFLGVGAAAALLFWLLFRLPRRFSAPRQISAIQHSVWRRALSPAITAAKIGVLLSIMSGIRTRHLDLAVRFEVTLLFAAFLSIAGFVLVYVIALLICASTQRPNQPLQPTAGRSDV